LPFFKDCISCKFTNEYVIVTDIFATEIRDFEAFLCDQGFANSEIYLTYHELTVILSFKRSEDLVMFKLKDVMGTYRKNKPYYFDPDLEFEEEIATKYGLYGDADFRYFRKKPLTTT